MIGFCTNTLFRHGVWIHHWNTIKFIRRLNDMKRKIILIFILLFNVCLFAQEFIFPPELKWWLDEIQKIDKNVSLEKFEFYDECPLYEEDVPVSFKNKLYPVLKKWNYFGDMFACYPIRCSLKKNRKGK